MITAGNNRKEMVINRIHKPVGFINLLKPETGEIFPQSFEFF